MDNLKCKAQFVVPSRLPVTQGFERRNLATPKVRQSADFQPHKYSFSLVSRISRVYQKYGVKIMENNVS